MIIRGWIVLVVGVVGAIPSPAVAFQEQAANDVAGIARRILDDDAPQEEREALIREHPAIAVELIAAMVADLEAGTPEEYRRIPWIWRVAVAAGRRNSDMELRRLLDLSLPAHHASLDDWRAVVLGGGIVNGIGLEGAWPGARIAGILEGHEDLQARWHQALEQAAVMADDEKVPTGTRYDALRMIAMEPWDRCGGQLFRYLLKGVHPELQQGAISGLGDLPSPCVAQAILSGLDHYSASNRDFALDALLRDESRMTALLDAIEVGRMTSDVLGAERAETLRTHPSPEIRERAARLLKP